MLEGFMITLREGMEAFLIVGLSIAFLRKSGRRGLESAVHWGIATAVMVCAAAGILLYQVAFNQALWEGMLSLVAAVFVGVVNSAHVASRSEDQEGYENRLEVASTREEDAVPTGQCSFLRC